MSTPLALLLGMVVGAGVVALIWAVVARRSQPPPVLAEPTVPRVAPATEAVLDVLRSATVVVGANDEVLHASPQARSLGLVLNTRVQSDALQVVREIRGTTEIRNLEIEQRSAPVLPPMLLRIRVAPLPDEQVLLLAEDRTAAARVEATRRDFTTNVSHELKTPIGAVSLLAEAVEDAADDPDRVRSFAQRLQVESQRLADLVAQIIQLSRLQADDPLLSAELVDVDHLLKAARDASQARAGARNVSVTITGETGCRVLGDARQLAIAVSNLVSNAITYSDVGARVVLSAARRHEADLELVQISVSDNGIGIAQGDLERIFERFYRVDYARSRASGGTGLGLSIVKHVAAAHGGAVGVWSKAGAGSTFTLKLPAQLPADPRPRFEPVTKPGRTEPAAFAGGTR